MSGVAVSRKVPPSRASSIGGVPPGGGPASDPPSRPRAPCPRSDELAERASDRVVPRARPTREANASLAWTIRSVAIGDDDEIDERVEGVFEQPPLPQDLLEQLDVLDADRQLVSELVRELDELHFVEVAARPPRRGPACRAPAASRGAGR